MLKVDFKVKAHSGKPSTNRKGAEQKTDAQLKEKFIKENKRVRSVPFPVRGSFPEWVSTFIKTTTNGF